MTQHKREPSELAPTYSAAVETLSHYDPSGKIVLAGRPHGAKVIRASPFSRSARRLGWRLISCGTRLMTERWHTGMQEPEPEGEGWVCDMTCPQLCHSAAGSLLRN